VSGALFSSRVRGSLRATLKRTGWLCAAFCLAGSALRAAPTDFLGITESNAQGGANLSLPLRIALSLTLLTFLPAVIMALTPFLRISVVLHFLRQALGTQTAPSNQVLIGLALFLSMVIMRPVGVQIYETAWMPMEEGKISATQAVANAVGPLKNFMVRFAREKDIQLFLEITKSPSPKNPAELDFVVLAPAYVLSELKSGFQIGAVLYLPFLVIDLVVASITVSIGMIQLPPVMISAPFKLLLFVLVDGWNLIVGSLVKTFYA
jgi:flagellar biosynthetic protein FliP